jgi:hypothetical protein
VSAWLNPARVTLVGRSAQFMLSSPDSARTWRWTLLNAAVHPTTCIRTTTAGAAVKGTGSAFSNIPCL